MLNTLLENSWHIGLLLFTPIVRPKYRKLYAGIILVGAAYHIWRSHTWRV